MAHNSEELIIFQQFLEKSSKKEVLDLLSHLEINQNLESLTKLLNEKKDSQSDQDIVTTLEIRISLFESS